MSYKLDPQGSLVCTTEDHSHKLLADARACAFSQCWDEGKRRADEATAEGATGSLEAADFLPGDKIRLAPNVYVEVTSKREVRHPAGTMIQLTCDEGTVLTLKPTSIRYAIYAA